MTGIPRLSAHRGGPEGIYAPNSVAAIRAACELGVDLVEFDIRTTRDGRFVVAHDASVDVAGRRTLIADLEADAVLQSAEGAASAAEVLELLPADVMGHVDLKDARLEVEVADLCEAILGRDRFILTTLEDASVHRLRQERPHLKVALSLGRSTRGLPRAAAVRLRMSEVMPARRVARCGATMLALHEDIARAGALRWANRHGLDVLVWTVNEPSRIRRVMADERLWGFTTDYPRLAIQLREG